MTFCFVLQSILACESRFVRLVGNFSGAPVMVLLYWCWHAAVASGSKSVWQRRQVLVFSRLQCLTQKMCITLGFELFLVHEKSCQTKGSIEYI